MFQFHHTCITVSDFEASLNFYQKIGFSSTFHWQADDESIKLEFLKIGNRLIEILYYADYIATQSKSEIESQKKVGFCHIALSVDNIEKAKQELEVLLNQTFIIEIVGTHFKHFFIQDPDKNYIEIIEDNFHKIVNLEK